MLKMSPNMIPSYLTYFFSYKNNKKLETLTQQ